MNVTPCFCTNLRRASQALTKLYDNALAPAGITIAQFWLLHAIARLTAPTIGRLAAESELDRSTLGRNVKLLVRHGLAQYGPGADARSKVISLTEQGRRALMRATPIWETLQTGLNERLGSVQDQALFTLLDGLSSDFVNPSAL